ncbi:partner of Y14 and mago-like [Littorina saxatilis]|uniref:WIBG Mago-binding domain-containing protein n=1 Tax=Littorina saxatilis TaxID=31220 RepID=A0AAN9BTD3_9CAEN
MASQVEREGVVRDEKTGELLIPASRRPDGSWRKARRVKDGYIPQEEVPVFETKGTQWQKSRPTHPIGLAPEDVEKMERAKKAASEPVAASQANMSKAAKKNAKRKEKKKQPGGDSTSGVSQVTTGVEQVKISNTATAGEGTEAQADLAKKLKNLKKKLKQIEDLEKKIQSGELPNPEKDQLEKVAKKQSVLDEIEDIELEMEES